jgi:hypothetical protein
MTFSQLTDITNRGHTRLLETREIIKTQNRPNDMRRWMTKPSMPLIRLCRVANKGLMKGLDVGRLEGIETILTLSFQKQLSCCPILYEIIPWMKFKKTCYYHKIIYEPKEDV